MISVRQTISDSLNTIPAIAFSSVEMESDMLKSKHFFGAVFLIQISLMENFSLSTFLNMPVSSYLG